MQIVIDLDERIIRHIVEYRVIPDSDNTEVARAIDQGIIKCCMKESGLSMASEDGSKPEIYDSDDKVWRSDVLDLFGHGTMYTSKEAQKMIKDLPSAEV